DLAAQAGRPRARHRRPLRGDARDPRRARRGRVQGPRRGAGLGAALPAGAHRDGRGAAGVRRAALSPSPRSALGYAPRGESPQSKVRDAPMFSLLRPPGDEAVLRAAPDTPGCASHAKQWVLAAAILGSGIAFLEASVINVALPAIQDALSASVAELQGIASAYTVALASLTLVSGAAGDRFGKVRLFVWGAAGLAL